MADLITDLKDADIRTEWLRPGAEVNQGADDDATDPGGADDDATDPGGDDADTTDADDDDATDS